MFVNIIRSVFFFFLHQHPIGVFLNAIGLPKNFIPILTKRKSMSNWQCATIGQHFHIQPNNHQSLLSFSLSIHYQHCNLMNNKQLLVDWFRGNIFVLIIFFLFAIFNLPNGWIKTKTNEKKNIYIVAKFSFHDGINDDVNDNDNGKWLFSLILQEWLSGDGYIMASFLFTTKRRKIKQPAFIIIRVWLIKFLGKD